MIAEAALIASAIARMGPATRYASIVDATLARGAVLLAKVPRSAGHWLAVAEARQGGPLQIVVAEDSRTDGELARAARRLAPGGAIIVSGGRDEQPLLDGRGPVGGRDAVYVCRGTVCDLPTTSAAELASKLG